MEKKIILYCLCVLFAAILFAQNGWDNEIPKIVLKVDSGIASVSLNWSSPEVFRFVKFDVFKKSADNLVFEKINNSYLFTPYYQEEITQPGQYEYYIKGYDTNNEFYFSNIATCRIEDMLPKPKSNYSSFNNKPFSLQLIAQVPGSTIHYTTDGSEPNKGSNIYRTAIPILKTTVIKARSYAENWKASDMLELHFTISTQKPVSEKKEVIRKTTSIAMNKRLSSIEVAIAKTTFVDISVYNILGQRIKNLYNGKKNAGNYTFNWDHSDKAGKPISEGIYFFKVKTGNSTTMKKVLVLN